MKQSRFPKGWDEERVKRVIDHYENQTEEEAVAEDEAAWEDTSQTFLEVPNENQKVFGLKILKKKDKTSLRFV